MGSHDEKQERVYDKLLDIKAVQHGFKNWFDLLKHADNEEIDQTVRQALFYTGWEETLNYQLEVFELRDEIKRLRAYLQ